MFDGAYPTALTFVMPAFSREPATVVGGIIERAHALGLARHEADERREDGANAPRRLPCFLVVRGHGEADALADLEAAVVRQEDDLRRLEGVFRGQQNAAVVNAVGERGVGGPAHGEVPFEQVGF